MKHLHKLKLEAFKLNDEIKRLEDLNDTFNELGTQIRCAITSGILPEDYPQPSLKKYFEDNGLEWCDKGSAEDVELINAYIDTVMGRS